MNFLVFLGICLVATASPGPAVFLAIKNGAKYGHKNAMFGIAGNVSAMLTLASVSAAGLGAIILASSHLYTAIKIIGGLYLIYIGIKSWRQSSVPPVEEEETDPTLSAPRKLTLFRESYFVGISNPKAIVFYTALFPQFINLAKPVFPQFVLLALTFATCSFAFLMFYSSIASKLKPYIERENISRWFNRITGGVFIGFGAALLANNRV
ncbi:LysE family translocator [Gynuella sunshinyii]|uniref:Putative threonine efflux protein n=1 Tax=Gynuella sunshinyii YC6258 TaxID=1445510 RepID=A0A0C5VHS5_9GAMM|nr:LysE family translocator [Gynuella sunshinyii]AJQ94207.1 putative threonine efflux protein [Gynuella sunshinyii YC6258]